MTVLEIKEFSKGRYRVCLEGGEDMVLYRGEIRKLQIRLETDLSEEQYIKIQDEILRPRCRKYALHLLEKQERTKAELGQKLKEKGYSQEMMEDAISYCESYGYINDSSYAERYVRTYQMVKSDAQLKNILYKKGISKDLIERALLERSGDEKLLIRKLLKKRSYVPETVTLKEQQKIFRYLWGKGFSYDDIRQEMKL